MMSYPHVCGRRPKEHGDNLLYLPTHILNEPRRVSMNEHARAQRSTWRQHADFFNLMHLLLNKTWYGYENEHRREIAETNRGFGRLLLFAFTPLLFAFTVYPFRIFFFAGQLLPCRLLTNRRYGTCRNRGATRAIPCMATGQFSCRNLWIVWTRKFRHANSLLHNVRFHKF